MTSLLFRKLCRYSLPSLPMLACPIPKEHDQLSRASRGNWRSGASSAALIAHFAARVDMLVGDRRSGKFRGRQATEATLNLTLSIHRFLYYPQDMITKNTNNKKLT